MATFYLETYGCQMNEYDSQLAATILTREKFKQVKHPEEADYILLNTCAIRENAHQKVYHRLQELAHFKKQGGRIAILGCMAQNLKEELLQKEVAVDFLIGPDALRELANIGQMPQKSANLALSRSETYDDIFPHDVNKVSSIHAYVAIQRGCNNFCSFCVVPYTRGRERSRPVISIINEIKALTERGVKMVTLLGQNVNSYRYQSYDFTGLVEEILEKTSIERIYFTSPHPKDFPEKLLCLMAKEERFGNYIHLPLQSGSDRILKKMKRNYTKNSYLELVSKIKETIPNVALSTDVIVGFSSETEEDFLETLEVIEKAEFDFAFMFSYSERKGTIASRIYPDDIPQEEKNRRLRSLIDLQNKISLRKNESYIGRMEEVIAEKKSRRNPNELLGRMRNFKKVVFNPLQEANFGKRFTVKIQKATSMTLIGEVICP